MSGEPSASNGFAGRIAQARVDRVLIVQPRMGFSDPAAMRAGLLATRASDADTVGTITLDSYTRVRDVAAATRSVAAGDALNGYPILSHPPETTRALLDGVATQAFPVQVRHGSPEPQEVITRLAACGIDATEGGPVSYCLPYGRIPLRTAVHAWRRSCMEFAQLVGAAGGRPHLESFGGCMLGQLCPPSLLVALTVLEALFFRAHGVRDVSVSLAQQSNARQDAAALAALAHLGSEFLGATDWHIVVYTYMGVFPMTAQGAEEVLADAARLAVRGGAARLIVKSAAEARRIPTIAENVAALEHAARVARGPRPPAATGAPDGQACQVYGEARRLVEATLDLDADIGTAILAAFGRGYLDVPCCLHTDNAGRAGSTMLADGTLVWSSVGSMPIGRIADVRPRAAMSSADLLRALSFVRDRYDAAVHPRQPAGVPR